MPRPKRRILVVTADAGRARLFECTRLGGPLRQLSEKSADLGAAGARCAAAAARFFDEVTEADAKQTFDALVLCAPSKALGVLRQQLPDALSEKIVLTAARDHLRETPADLAKRLEELALETRE